MARMEVTTNISDIYADIDDLIGNMGKANVAALKAQEKIIQEKVKASYISAGGKDGDYIYDSIGQSVNIGSNGVDAVGTVGVYKIDSVMSSHGREVGKDITAPQIAYWLEYGTSRLNNTIGGAKKKNANYPEEYLSFTSPRPFVSNAFYSTIKEQEEAFKEAFVQYLEDN